MGNNILHVHTSMYGYSQAAGESGNRSVEPCGTSCSKRILRPAPAARAGHGEAHMVSELQGPCRQFWGLPKRSHPAFVYLAQPWRTKNLFAEIFASPEPAYS